mmetsp:Transcript_20749/g.48112  ORF Transcript_20749/g.48112 Transcript_20749/m.48112 type:complete len:204 (-) Transcript_20749:570-1181(-)
MLWQVRRPRQDLAHLQRGLDVPLPRLGQRQGAGHRRVQQRLDVPVHRRPQCPDRARQGRQALPRRVPGVAGRLDRHHQQLRLARARLRGRRRRRRGCARRRVLARLVRRPALLRRLPRVDEAGGWRPPPDLHRRGVGARQGQRRLLRPQPLRHRLGHQQRGPRVDGDPRRRVRGGLPAGRVDLALRRRLGPPQAPQLGQPSLR